MVAVEHNQLEVVRYFLGRDTTMGHQKFRKVSVPSCRLGCSIHLNRAFVQGRSLLVFAARKGRLPMLQLLFENRVKPQEWVRSSVDWTWLIRWLSCAVLSAQTNDGHLLHVAAQFGHLDVVKFLVLRAHLPANARARVPFMPQGFLVALWIGVGAAAAWSRVGSFSDT